MKFNIINDNTLFTIKTDCALDDIKRVAQHCPEQLSVTEVEGYPIFTIGIAGHGCGCINSKGAEFAPVATSDGKAKITLGLPETEDPADYVAEQYVTALKYLQQIERQVTMACHTLENTKNEIKQMINVIAD